MRSPNKFELIFAVLDGRDVADWYGGESQSASKDLLIEFPAD
jgi:hypothetical protein